ncbi:hypothetical protein UA08_00827 [Talaromyces atroroseus]|uniref:Major facilitator superfamily (MFS) profile domain-containing protein n=1 Tax=Talaromyces atroroseus TaxID=1441469 RepID=A0A225B6G3_TALAT|nr:hypothetical protein UA08_00827 [Talaromyces atroroseus]OKL63719.1 hypothetical protein UA08_00827 [Talaromyces atroroseus]
MAYPEPNRKGFFISLVYSSLSVGGLLGGIIALAFNATDGQAGSITLVSYIPLIAISALGPFIAWLLAPPERVIRTDGLPVNVKKLDGPWQEAKQVFVTLKNKKILLLLPMFVYSQWFLSYQGNFITLYHSVRGTALGAHIQQYTSKRTGLDHAGILAQCISIHILACYMYFVVGTLSDQVEELARYTSIMKTINTAGIALGYGVQVKWSMMGAEALLCGLFFIQIFPAWCVIRDIADYEDLVVDEDPLPPAAETTKVASSSD